MVSLKCGVRKNTVCNLSGRRLEKLDDVVWPEWVTILNLDRNNIRSLEYVRFSRKLEVLSLSSNKITVSGRGIDLSYSDSLQVLRYICYTPKCMRMKMLYFQTTNDCIGRMDHNRIDSMDHIRLPKALKHLSVRGNVLQNVTLGQQNVHRLQSLNVLDFGLNRIDKLQGDITGEIGSVQTLKLDMNNISMDRVTFPLTLRHIDLSNNHIDTLDVVNLKQLLASGVHIEVDGDHESQSRFKMQMDHIIPVHVFDQNQTSAALECRICCEQIVTGEEVKTLPCMHMFHCQCIVKFCILNTLIQWTR